MELTLSELFTGLLAGKNKNFYGQVLNALDKIPLPGIGTMGVAIKGSKLVLVYDPEFLKNISFDMGVFTIEHEGLHLVLDHIPRFLELLSISNDEEYRKKLRITSNPAMDCAVNDFLRKDPEWSKVENEFPWCLPERYGMQANKAYEEYQSGLMQQCNLQTLTIKGVKSKCKGESCPCKDKSSQKSKQGPGQGQGQDQGDKKGSEQGCGDKSFGDLQKDFSGCAGGDHEGWDKDMEKEGEGQGQGQGNGDITVEVSTIGQELTSEELQSMADQLREQAKHVLRRAVNEHKKGRGTIPAGLEQWLEKYLQDPVVPWYELLTTRVKVTQQKKPKRSIERPSRKLMSLAQEDPEIIPAIGKSHDPKFRVFFVVDTSGSMSDKSLVIARSELQHLLDADDDMEVRWMEVDAAVAFDQVFKRGDTLPDKIHGRGGTDFNTSFEYIIDKYMKDDLAPDIIIYYTDGGAPCIEQSNYIAVPLVWLICDDAGGKAAAQHLIDAGYGEVIICDKNQTSEWHSKNS